MARKTHKAAATQGATPKKTRLSGGARKVGHAWTLSARDRERIDWLYGVTKVIEGMGERVHEDDRELLFNSIAATLAFHEFSDRVDQLQWQDELEELRDDLEVVRIGYELALKGLDQVLQERSVFLDRPRAMALVRHARDPKRRAKEGALGLWLEWYAGKHPGIRRVADFATAVMERWPELKNAKTIEGWSASWTKEARAGRTPVC